MVDTDDVAALPVTRGQIVQEYADGELAVRCLIETKDVEAFWRCFPDIDEAGFLACAGGALEVVRGNVMKEYADGSLAVKVLIPPASKAAFRELWPRPSMPAVLARERPERGRQSMIDSTATKIGDYGAYAKALRLTPKFLLNPKVWRAIGSDEDYLSYVRTMPCAVCKWRPHWEMDNYVSCEAAHVRRVADGAGTALRPEYSAIPLCPTRPGVPGCHAKQHQHGESAIGGKEAVDKLRIDTVQAWAWAALKDELGYEHMNEVPPEVLVAWAEDRGVVEFLPECYLGANRGG